MKKLLLIIIFMMSFSLLACSSNNAMNEPNATTPSITTPAADNNTTTPEAKCDETMNKTLELKIDNIVVEVFWLDNDSVKALKELAKDGLTLELHEYGGFEQTGLIGSTITSNDSWIDVDYGDIVLYQSKQICLYYDKNSYSFTKLGHINLSKSEVRELLADKDNVTITLTLK